MKTKFYLLTVFTFLTLVVSAQFPNFNTMLAQEWTNNEWVNTMQSTNTYDANGHLISTVHQEWIAETSTWDNAINIKYTLNTDGTVKETASQLWEEGAWQDFQKTLFTYSPTKKVLTETTQFVVEGTAMDFSKVTKTYNANDSLETELYESYNFLTQGWSNSSKDTYTYNADGTLNQTLYQNWGAANDWENSMRFTNTYDNSKKILSDLSEEWVDGAWVNNSRTNYTYENSELPTESFDQVWLNEQWTDTLQSAYTYTAANEMQQIVSQIWNAELSQWVNYSRITFTHDATGIEDVKLTSKAFKAFPNPFVDQITIQSHIQGVQDVEIFNSSGQLIKSLKTQEKTLKLDLESLHEGIYFIKVKTPQGEQSLKVLKVR